MPFKWMLANGLLLLSVSFLHAQVQYSADTGECGDKSSQPVSAVKTPVRFNKTRSMRVYGKLEFRQYEAGAKDKHCHVIYRLLLAVAGKPFREVKRMEWDTEQGEIAGIDLVGFSPNESNLAADFWLAEGDGELHRPVVYNLKTNSTTDRPLEDLIQKRINGCDQNEDFIGVSDSGEAVFAIPPSNYDNSPGCGDKGLWHFNLQTGKVYRVKKISGIKW
jgi:hypothetical protein